MCLRTVADRPFDGLRPASRKLLALVLVMASAALPATVNAQRRERLGTEVVDTVCAACHATGVERAPRIGDRAAWAPRASQGLTALTEHALNGVRSMPAHGGNAGVSDIEIERAIIVMVNRSGGRWIEPIGGATPAVVRSSERIVQTQCATCHRDGADGAPKIGDRAAWIPRLKKGLDPLVASAIHGHGPMPARGGLPDLSDEEIRGAIVHMFNVGVVAVPSAPQTARAANDPYHKQVASTDIYLGVVPAAVLRAAQAQGKILATLHGGIPSGKDQYHLNISLADSMTRVSVTNADVKIRVTDALGAEAKTLNLMAENNAVSYGNFFRLAGGTTHTITVEIRRPGVANVIESRFEYKAR